MQTIRLGGKGDRFLTNLLTEYIIVHAYNMFTHLKLKWLAEMTISLLHMYKLSVSNSLLSFPPLESWK